MTETTGIEEKAVELIEKFEALATDIAPDAVELGLMAARVAAANDTLIFVVGLALAVFGVPKIAHFMINGSDDIKDVVPAVVFGSLGILGGMAALAHASLWGPVGIFYPELWIAKQVLGW